MEGYPDSPDPAAGARRRALARARLLLVFTPGLVRDDPAARLREALPAVDVIQIRVKRPGSLRGPSPARPVLEWAERALELVETLPGGRRPLVTVDDRVDVAGSLAGAGLDGVHLGDRDQPPADARRWLGPGPLLGWSTHSLAEVEAAEALPVDYLGFGPVAATATKGLDVGLGAEVARAAAERSSRPVFAIGGITPALAGALGSGARVAVGAALLDSPDVAAAAAGLRDALAAAAP